MNFKIKHPDFLKKDLILSVTFFKINILYDQQILILKWGKVNILDDYNNNRSLKLKDLILTSPKILIDKKLEINVLPKISSLIFIFLFPSILLFLYGPVGIVLGVLNMFYIRNLFIIKQDKFKNCLISLIITFFSFILTFFILFMLNLILNL